MTNKERLLAYQTSLVNALNENSFKITGIFSHDGQPRKYYVNPESTNFMMMITDDYDAYEFLEKNGYLKKDMCQFCGEYPIDGTFKFTEPSYGIKLNICSSCHPQGISSSSNFQNKGCMLVFIIPILLGLSLLLMF